MELTPSPHGWLDRPRTVGTPRHWAKHAGLLGAALGWLVPGVTMATGVLVVDSSSWMVWFALVNPLDLAGAVVGGLAGALLGLVQPALLDRLRGRAPMPVVALSAVLQGAIAGGLAGAAVVLPFVFAPSGMPIGLAAATTGAAAAVGAAITPVWWVPFTVMTVLRGRAWLATAAVGVGLPVTALAVGALMALFV